MKDPNLKLLELYLRKHTEHKNAIVGSVIQINWAIDIYFKRTWDDEEVGIYEIDYRDIISWFRTKKLKIIIGNLK